MSGRHVLAITNSTKAADLILSAAREDFPSSTEHRLVHDPVRGWLVEITVDADEFERWIAP